MAGSIRPTARGIAVMTIALVAFMSGSISGPRSLDAVVVSALVVLAAGYLQLQRADPPAITRKAPEPGFPGTERTIDVSVDSSQPCIVDERTPVGIEPEPTLREVGHGGQFSYDVRLERRGIYDLGPATCKQTDSFGLFSRYRRLEPTKPATVVVYPPVYDLDFDVTGTLDVGAFGDGRRSFSHLREYTTADRMGDIHWRSSAKRPLDEFLVTEHDRDGRNDRVTIVGESIADGSDSMAAAVASLATAITGGGVAVDVTLPDDETTSRSGGEESLLWTLASTDGGRVGDAERGDVRVVSDGRSTTIRTADRNVDFGDWVDTEDPTEVG